LILHPEVSNYPFHGLCGTAVAWKLACALRDASGLEVEAGDLDLVALATVADVVPLVGENRSLVRRGLAEMRRARRVGLRALIAASKCEPTRLDETDLAFRLAPRINAAGRLYRADAGVELMLTDDEARAEAIAEELGRANSERRATEREVDTGAEAARRELPEELKAAPALVVAGEGWHPGVVGIVASRLVERHHRPAIVISLDGDGGGRGSGRSIPGFDLHAALGACAEHLDSFGGHKMAAGLALRAENLDAFRAAFCAYATRVLKPEDLLRTERIDAMVGGVGIGLELAEELGQLAPFGMGNPGVRLMVPSARVSDVRTMGEEGKHSRFSLHSGSHRALGVAFGRSSLGVEDDEMLDAAVRLEVNHWNGAVEPRVVLREVYPLADGVEGEAVVPHACGSESADWWARFEAELTRDLGGGLASSVRIANPSRQADGGVAGKSVIDRGNRRGLGLPRRVMRGTSSVSAAVAELVSSGAGVLAVSADASRRSALANGATGLARFNGGHALVACHRCTADQIAALAARAKGGLALTDYSALAMAPDLAAAFEHVVLVDAPRGGAEAQRASLPRTRAAVAPDDAEASRGIAPGYLHPLFTQAEEAFGLSVLERQAPSRAVIASVFRALRESAELGGEELRAALSGGGPHPLAPEAAARALRVLMELGLVAGEAKSGAGVVGVVSSEGTQLERSAAFRAYSTEFSEAHRFLKSRKFP
jgi:single-stranded-DNA-specific exonuclease